MSPVKLAASQPHGRQSASLRVESHRLLEEIRRLRRQRGENRSLLTRSGRHPLGRWIPGPRAAQILDSCPTPNVSPRSTMPRSRAARPCRNTQANRGGLMTQVIVSYDGTRNDRDALALGRLFAAAGCEISLAYVRHATEPDPQQEATAQREAEHLLAIGAGLLDGTGVEAHVIVNSSTAEGLATLAAELGADVIAFGSSYRTPAGRVELPHTAEQLLDRGSRARSRSLRRACGASRSSKASGQSVSMTRTTTKPRWRAQRALPMRSAPS